MKYVIFKGPRNHRFAVIFADQVTHSDVKIDGCEPISAGFVSPRTGECFGGSSSLKLQTHSDDIEIVGNTLVDNSAMLNMLNVGYQFPDAKAEPELEAFLTSTLKP